MKKTYPFETEPTAEDETTDDRTGADLIASLQASPYRDTDIEPEPYGRYGPENSGGVGAQRRQLPSLVCGGDFSFGVFAVGSPPHPSASLFAGQRF